MKFSDKDAAISITLMLLVSVFILWALNHLWMTAAGIH